MKIKGFIETSLLDWEGMIVSTLYVPYCNFRCPYCQNSGLVLNPEQYGIIPFETIKNYLVKHRDWIDGICLTGGEPCLHKDLVDFVEKIRELGMQVKLDTNGAFPRVLQEILDIGILDYVAMDIKAPLEIEAYNKSAGIKSSNLVPKIEESIRIIMESGVDYEFRTTVVPTLHRKEDIETIARHIKGARKYALQNFVPQNTLDSDYMKIKPYSIEELSELAKGARKYVRDCYERGK